MSIDRLPALPLIASDPYMSIWSPYDRLTDGDTAHWTGAAKPLRGKLLVDGTEYRFLGAGDAPAMETVEQTVTATATSAVLSAGGVNLIVTFRTPALPDDLELLSTPITFVDFALEATDGRTHQAVLTFFASSALTYDGECQPELTWGEYPLGAGKAAWIGQRQQKLLCHSDDHITIDWGYLYVTSALPMTVSQDGITLTWETVVTARQEAHMILGYDDVASILYFGTPCKAWYARNGMTLPGALAQAEKNRLSILSSCRDLDNRLSQQACVIGGEDYRLIVNAAWRHTFAAHKLIATPAGEMAFLSKENDSNGCIGTVDVSYPSSPLFLCFCPRLVEAMCRPILAFASLPVWEFDYAPHDVGRYPIVGGQVYAAECRSEFRQQSSIYPPFYLYPAGCHVYAQRGQMPVEECGNMLIMLSMAAEKTGDYSLISHYRPLLEKWVKYLTDFGEDPGEQLCTDDFAGHLAHNVNLSAKAVLGVALWGRTLTAMGFDGEPFTKKSEEMARSWYARAKTKEATALTFDGQGWSMKYNTIWDKVLDLKLFPDEFYRRETDFYLSHTNCYGLPLDSRADYTKSDWLVWTACLAPDSASFRTLIAPLKDYLLETQSRVPFSDWYYTSTGLYHHFIARSVQGGIYMPFLLG